MTNSPTESRVLQYSPRPIESYTWKVGDTNLGPAYLRFIAGTPESWNLAFISHDYAKQAVHPDGQFGVHVLNTVRFVLRHGLVDTIGNVPADMKVEGLLRRAPGIFVESLLSNNDYRATPLYRAYGEGWVQTIRQRVAECSPHPGTDLLNSIDVMPDDFTGAKELLARF